MAKPRPNLSWIGHTIGRRYKIESVLGQGGMSSVYKATDPNLRRNVAVKLIHPHLSSDPEFVRRFEQEAAAVAQLRHPNIIQVYDFNHDEDIYYMVLEFVPGETLQRRLQNLDAADQRLPVADIIHIMATTCNAVAYAHEQGMIHRDLKPANVMLTPKGQPILMDFGVAKMLGGTSHTATGAIIGTAKYMSPEQARGERPDERTDIYSLGVVLYEMVAGQPPFDADTTVAVLMKHVSEPVPDIRRLRNDVPEELVAVIEKALSKKPADRFQSAAEMATALRAIDLGTQEMEPLDSTQLATVAQQQEKAAIRAESPAPASVVPAQPQKTGRQTLWIAGAAVLILLLLGVGAAFFLLNGTGDSAEAEEQAVAMTQTEDLPSATGMAHISEGTYFVGLDPADGEHAPAQRVELDEFWIDRHEVTNAQYAGFLTDTDGEPPADWLEGSFPSEQKLHPVKGVTWDQAVAYCQWTNKRLPTEAEWEAAARGADGRLYPWGDNQRAVELPRSGTYEVGSITTNQTATGVFDMAGNVWEWVAEPYAEIEEGHRLLRGGANGFIKDMAYRLHGEPGVPTMFSAAGIRCAADQVDTSQVERVEIEDGVLYQDSFADPGSGWPVLAEDVRYFGYHPPDFYHIELSLPEKRTVITRPPNFEDVTIESEARVDHTETENGNFRYGLVVRRTGEEQYYAFVVSSRTGTWEILKSSSNGLEILAEGSVDTLKGFAPQGFTPDESDTLRVDAGGSNFAFQVNGKTVAQVSDSDYTSGEAGFFVETLDETLAHLHYDTLTVRELEGEVIAAAPATETSEPELPSPTPEEVAATEEILTATEEVPVTTEAAPTVTPVSDTLPTTEPELPTSSPTPSPTVSPTSPPTATPTASSTPTPTAEPATATPTTPAVPEEMVSIPAGSFLMGSNTGQPDEAPEHQVSLNAFFIDQFEVTNAEYRQCVNDGGCSQTSSPDSFTRTGYRDDPAFNNHPVVNVTWNQAAAYCRWTGKRLPTEAEWEYAAGGPDNLTWPWGNTFNPNLSAASAPDTEPVNSHPEGVSPFGIFNMAGNVNEWVQDLYDPNFYAGSPAQNPINTGSGDTRVFRGGSFANPDGAFYTTSRRYDRGPAFSDVDMGFRCAMDAG